MFIMDHVYRTLLSEDVQPGNRLVHFRSSGVFISNIAGLKYDKIMFIIDSVADPESGILGVLDIVPPTPSKKSRILHAFSLACFLCWLVLCNNQAVNSKVEIHVKEIRRGVKGVA